MRNYDGERDWVFSPYEIGSQLSEQYREAVRARDREAEKRYKEELIRFYVHHGEHYKMSNTPDYDLAKRYLKRALKLDDQHPLANYRYGHLLYRDKEYEKAAYHFRKALDGNLEEGLNDSQTLVAQMMLVNCGLLMAKDALREVKYLQGNEYLSYDNELIETFYDKMLVQSEEMLAHHMYCHITPEGMRHISRDEYQAYQERAGDDEVLLIVDDSMYARHAYNVKYREIWWTMSPQSFWPFWILVRSQDYVGTEDLMAALAKSGLELGYDHVRQILSRLSRNVPFWHEIIETKEEGRRTWRRRREGVTYSLLCPSHIVLP